MVILSRWVQGPWRFVAMALLLVVVAHATAPVVQPLDRTTGSAFSASSSDVTVACGTRVVVAKTALPDNTPQPPASLSPQPFSVHAAAPCLPDRTAFDATGPPAAQTSFHPLNPRAPPAA